MSGKFALVIGNTDYADPGLAQLTAPGKDAEGLARILRDPNLCGFDDVRISLNHLSSAVIESIDEFFDRKKPDDLLILYFSGHGIRDEMGSLYLAFKNTMRSRLRSTAIKADYIREAMDESRSKRQVLILDCCNSGAFPQGTKAEVGGPMGMMTALQGYGRYVLTASDATQFAWEGDRVIGQTENSLFTHYLVKGLEGEADHDGDGRITVDDLYHYAFEEISKVTPNQTPTKSASKQAGEVVLRQITRIEDTRPVPLPDDLIEATEDDRPFVREGAVQQLEKLLTGKNLGRARSAKELLERIAAEDDSYRVRQSAEHALAPIRQAEQTVAEEYKAKEEAERLAAEKAEEQRLALERDEARRTALEAQQAATEREMAALRRKADLAARQNAALDAMKAGCWEDAQGILQQLQAEGPGNVETDSLLARVQDEIARSLEQRRRQEQIGALYEQARAAIGTGQWKDALRTLDGIRTLDEKFVDADGLTELARSEIHREAQAIQLRELLSGLYANAVRLLDQGRYQDALENWKQIEAVDPQYQDVSHVKSIAKQRLQEISVHPPKTGGAALLQRAGVGWWIALAAVGFGLSRLAEAVAFHGPIPIEVWWGLRGLADGLIAVALLHRISKAGNWKTTIAWGACWSAAFAAAARVLPGPNQLTIFVLILALAPALSVLAASRLSKANWQWGLYSKILVGWFLAWMIGQRAAIVAGHPDAPYLWAIGDAISGAIGLWITIDLLRTEAIPAEDRAAAAQKPIRKSAWLLTLAFLSVVVLRGALGLVQSGLNIWAPGTPLLPPFLWLFILGGLYGTVVAVALRQALGRWGWVPSLIAVIGWAAGLGGAFLGIRAGLDVISVVMALCGLAVAAAIKWARRSTPPLIMILILGVWAFAWQYGNMLANYLVGVFATDYMNCVTDAMIVLFGTMATLEICEYRPDRLPKPTLLAMLGFAVGNGVSTLFPVGSRSSTALAVVVWGFIGGVTVELWSRKPKIMLMKGAACAAGLLLGYGAALLLPPYMAPDRYAVLTNAMWGAALGLAFALSSRRLPTILLLMLVGALAFVATSFYATVINPGGSLWSNIVRGGLIGLALGLGYARAGSEPAELKGAESAAP